MYIPFLKTKIKVVHLQSNISLSNKKAPVHPHSQTLRRELNRSIDRIGIGFIKLILISIASKVVLKTQI